MDDRTAAPNLQSAVTRGHRRRQSMRVTGRTGLTRVRYMRRHSPAVRACAACEVGRRPLRSFQPRWKQGRRGPAGNDVVLNLIPS